MSTLFTDGSRFTDGSQFIAGVAASVIPSALAARLSERVLTTTYCLKVTREDGQVFGFAELDDDINYDGQTYERNAYAPDAVTNPLGFSAAASAISGRIDSDTLTEDDILTGVWDNAHVELFMIDYEAPEAGAWVLQTGWVGEVRVSGLIFEAEFRALRDRLRRNAGRVFTPSCDVAQLGDDRCKRDLTSFTFDVTVADVISSREFTHTASIQVDGYYQHGTAEWLTGGNAGVVSEVKSSTSAGAVELHTRLGQPMQIGDSVRLIAGCDRTFSTCQAKFANALNFRGFPYLPGVNKMLETP